MFCGLFVTFSDSPRTLIDQCRICLIRQCKNLYKLSHLPLPMRLLNFLQFKYTVEEIEIAELKKNRSNLYNWSHRLRGPNLDRITS